MEKSNNNQPQELKKLRWERDFSHNWNILKNPNILKQMESLTLDSKEDEEENIIKQQELSQPEKMKNNINYNFNFLRNLIIVIDLSENLNAVDYKPNRHKYIFKELEWFINEFFKYNIASSLIIIGNKNYTSEYISPLCTVPNKLITLLNKDIKPEGSLSFSNCLRTCLESISTNKNMNNEILFICSSPITFDRDNIFSLISDITKYKTEINILSFETPMEILQKAAYLTKGILIHPKKVEDITAFFTYMIYKRTYQGIIILALAGQSIVEGNTLICSCHHKLCSMVYTCQKCKENYCALPAFCRHCTTLNVNQALLYQLKQSNTLEANPQCFPYKLIKYYNESINHQEYQDMFKYSLSQLVSQYKKELIKSGYIINTRDAMNDITLNGLTLDDFSLQFKAKLLILYIKYKNKTSLLFRNLLKNIPLDNSIQDYIIDNLPFLVKECFVCSGCDIRFNVCCIDVLSRIFVYDKCFDVICEECYQYIQENNIGCLSCES